MKVVCLKMEKRRLEAIEQYIFELFRERGSSRLLAKEVFDSTSEFSNSDLVRAFEDLEKRWRLLTRYTKEGSDWVTLTPDGAQHAGLDAAPDTQYAFLHPPRGIT
jgi:hypothetical protein